MPVRHSDDRLVAQKDFSSPGGRMRAIRKGRGYSRGRLAEMARCNEQTIRRMEKNQAWPDQPTFHRITVALRVEPDSLSPHEAVPTSRNNQDFHIQPALVSILVSRAE